MSLVKKIIDFESNKDSIEHWTTLKGDYRYDKIISFMEGNGVLLSWNNVTDYLKYDKRLLYNCFKYVVILEEFFKSIISKKCNFSYEDILKMEFSSAIDTFLNIKDFVGYDDMDLETLRKCKGSFIDLRNSVVHNKILLDRRFRSKIDEKNNVEGKTLKETLEIYRKVLPKTYRDGFVSDIRKCSDGLNINREFCFFVKEQQKENDDRGIITKMHILEKKIDSSFLDITKLAHAMNSSIMKNGQYFNGTWGTVGDGLLYGLLGERLLKEGLATKELITNNRIDLENNDTQSGLIKNEGIINFAFNDKHFYDDQDVLDNEKVVSSDHNDYLEAIIAAIYYDRGYNYLKKWFDRYLYDLLKKYKVEKKH